MSLLALWFQSTDMRSVSWWLPTGPARNIVWWAVVVLNLLVLLYVLHRVLMAGKDWSIPRALRERREKIQQQIREAEQAQTAAAARLAEIERRVGQLPAELETLRAQADQEAEQEFQRLVEAGRHEADAVIRAGRVEIEAAAKLARRELKGLAAALALDLARQRLQERLTPELDRDVVARAVEDMDLSRPN